jgi:putative membrane protein
VLRVALAALHLLAFALAISTVLLRGAALRPPVNDETLRRAFFADNLWGLSAVLLLGTGLWRYLGSLEKSTAYYNHDHFFITKMALLVFIFALELWPMVTLLRWRRLIAHGGKAEAVAVPRTAARISAISFLQVAIIVLMVLAATAMARGF